MMLNMEPNAILVFLLTPAPVSLLLTIQDVALTVLGEVLIIRKCPEDFPNPCEIGKESVAPCDIVVCVYHISVSGVSEGQTNRMTKTCLCIHSALPMGFAWKIPSLPLSGSLPD